MAFLNSNLKLWPPLDMSHVDRLHRIGNPSNNRGKPRQVIIKFTSYQHRQRVLTKKKALKGMGVFLNEDLTKNRSKIMWTARNLWKDRKFKDVWTSDGRILVRDWAGAIHQINSTQDLDALPVIPPPPPPKPLLRLDQPESTQETTPPVSTADEL